MLVLFYHEGLDFEWDDAKAEGNRAKHKVAFEDAARVFLDPNVQFIEDDGDYGETRVRAIGRVTYSTILSVVFADRGSCFRIISAWPASKADIRRYEYD